MFRRPRKASSLAQERCSLVNGYSDMPLAVSNQRKRMKDDKTSRKVIRRYLQNSLSKYGYVVKNWTKNKVSITLNTYSINGEADIIRLMYRDGNLYYAGKTQSPIDVLMDDQKTYVVSRRQEDHICSLADPTCTEKIGSFIKTVHITKLKERAELYKKQLNVVEDEIDFIDNPE